MVAFAVPALPLLFALSRLRTDKYVGIRWICHSERTTCDVWVGWSKEKINAHMRQCAHWSADDKIDEPKTKTMRREKCLNEMLIDRIGNDGEDEKDTRIFLRSYKSSL